MKQTDTTMLQQGRIVAWWIVDERKTNKQNINFAQNLNFNPQLC